MLATQMNHLMHDGKLEINTIVKVNNFICNNLKNKKVIILLDLEVVKSGAEVGKKIGNPVQINADGTVNQNANAPQPSAPVKRQAPSGDDAPQAKRSPLASNENRPRSSIMDPRPVVGAPSSSVTDPSQLNVYPIASLTPYQNKWTIKARVTHKSDIRRWSNSKGEGHLFSMDLLDESGEIRATLFKEQCDKYYNTVEVGKVNID